MKRLLPSGIPVLCAALGCVPLLAQVPAKPRSSGIAGSSLTHVSDAEQGPVVLEWVPPALAQLSSQAAVKENFTLDRSMLGLASGLIADSDADVKQAVGKLDGVSVHMLRFGADGIADPAEVAAVREAYHLRGWKHLVTASNSGGPLRNGTTDVWLVIDGSNVRGAVVLAETPKSLTLVTVAGNLSAVDLLHLRGHFGIPRFDGDDLKTGR